MTVSLLAILNPLLNTSQTITMNFPIEMAVHLPIPISPCGRVPDVMRYRHRSEKLVGSNHCGPPYVDVCSGYEDGEALVVLLTRFTLLPIAIQRIALFRQRRKPPIRVEKSQPLANLGHLQARFLMRIHQGLRSRRFHLDRCLTTLRRDVRHTLNGVILL